MGLNYLAILVAAIAAYAVGILWYGPLFGKQWRKLQGFDGAASMKGMAPSMIGGFLATLVMVSILAIFEGALFVSGVLGPMILAGWLWLGFVAPIMINMVFYEKKPWKLYFINVAHYLVALLVAALILAIW